MTPHFYTNRNGKTATPEQIVARVKPTAYITGLLMNAAAPLPAPTSSLVTPSWATPAYVIAAMGGVS